MVCVVCWVGLGDEQAGLHVVMAAGGATGMRH